jgi:hypothetical protein
MRGRFLVVFFTVFFQFFLGASAKKSPVSQPIVVAPVDEMTESAVDLLWRGAYGEADRQFDWALQRNPKSAQANIGRALAQGHMGNFDKAFEFLKNGCRYAKENDDRLFCHEVTIRLHTLDKQDKRWFEKARDAFIAGNKIDPRATRPYFYMALACKENMSFDEAENLFREVISRNSGYVEEARRQLAQLEGAYDTMPLTRAGRSIVLKKRISRADCAALIVEELKFGSVLGAQTTLPRPGKDFKRPKPKKIKTFSAKDIKDHPFAAYIESAMSLNLEGLQKYSDGMFRPDEYMDRGAFAVIVAGMMKKASPETVGRLTLVSSPFSDVDETSPFYEAVMVVASQGIMDAGDKTRNAFSPFAPLTGAEALSALQKLKKILQL